MTRTSAVLALVVGTGLFGCTDEDAVGQQKRELQGTRAEAEREVAQARDEAARRMVETERQLAEEVGEVEREAADDVDEAAEDIQDAIRSEDRAAERRDAPVAPTRPSAGAY